MMHCDLYCSIGPTSKLLPRKGADQAQEAQQSPQENGDPTKSEGGDTTNAQVRYNVQCLRDEPV